MNIKYKRIDQCSGTYPLFVWDKSYVLCNTHDKEDELVGEGRELGQLDTTRRIMNTTLSPCKTVTVMLTLSKW